MDKCEGCPFPEVLGTHMDFVKGLDPAIKISCHLTPSDMGAIGAAIRGEVYLMGIHPDIDRDSLGGMIAHALNL